MTCCSDCGTPLLPTNTSARCAECALVVRNEQLTTPELVQRRYALLRAVALAQRIVDMKDHQERYPK